MSILGSLGSVAGVVDGCGDDGPPKLMKGAWAKGDSGEGPW